MIDVMQTPFPPVTLIAWCPTCQHHLDAAKPGQRCPVGDPDCYSVLVKRRALLCTIGACSEVKMAILAPSGKPVKDVWRTHLMEDHCPW